MNEIMMLTIYTAITITHSNQTVCIPSILHHQYAEQLINLNNRHAEKKTTTFLFHIKNLLKLGWM